MAVFNVRDYGAKADGRNDAPAIQQAIDAAAQDGGVVYIPSGTYCLTESLYGRQNVSFRGDNWSSQLHWTGEKDCAILILTNEALWGVTVEHLSFSSDAEGVTGILGGSTLKKYNSAIGNFRNLRFSGLYCGISGGAEPEGVGIFDNFFENVFCSRCTFGLHLYGSGNTIIHPRVTNCEHGMVLDYLNGESFDSMHVFGGVFAANGCDIFLPSAKGTRPTDFVGTWFEDAKKGILCIAHPGTRVMNLTFRDCMLNSKADGENYFLLDARNAAGVVTLDGCTVIDDKGILRPAPPDGSMRISALQVYHKDQKYVINDEKHGSAVCPSGVREWRIPHGLRECPSGIVLTAADENAARAQYYVSADRECICVRFTDDSEMGECAFYWHARI